MTTLEMAAKLKKAAETAGLDVHLKILMAAACDRLLELEKKVKGSA